MEVDRTASKVAIARRDPTGDRGPQKGIKARCVRSSCAWSI